MKYKKISLEGFGSFCSPSTMALDRLGLNLVKGENGVGKTTIFNALVWCEYGKTVKKSIESWEKIRSKDYRGTRVVVDRTDGIFDYRIARHQKFKGTTCGLLGESRLMIFKKSVEEPAFTSEHLVGDGLHKNDMQLLIEQQLGCEHRTFVNSIIMRQKMAGLIGMSNNDKRELFDKLFEIDFIEPAKDRAKEKKANLNLVIQKLTGDISKLTNEAAYIEKSIAEQNRLLQEFEAKKQKFIDDFEAKKSKNIEDCQSLVTSYNKHIDSIQLKIDDLAIWLSENKEQTLEEVQAENKKAREAEAVQSKAIELVETKLEELTKNKSKYIKEIEATKAKIIGYEKDLSNVQTTCPYCQKDLLKAKVAEVKKVIEDKIKTEKTVIETLNAKLPAFDTDIEVLTKELKELEFAKHPLIEASILASGKYATLEKQNKEYQDKNHQLDILKSQLHSQQESLINASKSLTKAANEVMPDYGNAPSYDTADKEKRLSEISLELEKLTLQQSKESGILEQLNWWLSNGLSASGIRAYVFNSMLGKLNNYAKAYASRLGLGVEFTVDLSKASTPFNTIVYKGSQITDYEDLSGGQQQRADLCLLFAMQDLVSEKLQSNILVVDEGFEGLDEEGRDMALDILRLKAETKSVFIITHSDLIDTLNCRSIYVSGGNNVTSTIKG